MYCELHCHSAYSFLDGASLPEQLILQAHASDYPALALTDHNGLYGSMAFAQAAKHMAIQAITGAEMTMLDNSHVTLLAETPNGYANLCRLITEAHLEQEDRHTPKLDFATLERLHEGIIILSGCRRGLLATVLRNEGMNAARRLAQHCRAVFGCDHFFVELQRNRVRGDKALTGALCDIAGAAGLQVVATGNVHYHRQDRHRLHDALVAIRHRTTLNASHDIRHSNSQFYLRPPSEVEEIFKDQPDSIANTIVIAKRCESFDLTRDLGYTFPDFRGSQQTAAPKALAQLTNARLDELYPPGSPYRRDAEDRLKKELCLIEQHGLCGFFLVYRDLLELAREVAVDIRRGSRRVKSHLLPGRGRGSSVSSIVCYFLGLSHIDPVANRLFLGRFLNESLASIPDIDLDFPREIREELIRRVYQKYGSEHVGLVCSFPTYHLRSAVRELGKALDLPRGELEQIARLAGHQSATGLRDELNKLPAFADKATAPLWRELCDLAEEIAGLPRHISQHVGGMVISSRPLVELVPLERAAMPDRVICQWDKDSCDDARFVKIDFLALGMLSLVEECVELITYRNDDPPDLSRIDFQDEAVYDQICAGDTVGTFQIESRAQIQMIRRTRPRNLDDLCIEVAIVRPGPIVGGAVNPFVRRREEQRAALSRKRDYDPPVDHPLLRDALAETLGVIIYQDQVLQVCEALAGFTAGQAEALRRAMSRRRSRVLMEGFWQQFRDGAARLNVSEAIAKRVFNQVVAFSEFGFPKSHAAAFGLLAYQSTWLRHYYPVEYYAALFNNQPMGFYSLDTLGRDAARHGVEVRLPDVNRSNVECSIEKDAIRVGLGFLRKWGTDVAEAVVVERERNGSYVSLADFVRRAPSYLSRDAIENLVWVGGCDSFGLTRRELLWQVGLWLPPKTDRTNRHRVRRQLELPLNHPYENMRFANVSPDQRLVAEYQVLGFAPGGHPFTFFGNSLPAGIERSDQLDRFDHDAQIQVAGLVVARQRPSTAKGFTFILLEDEAGMINAIVRPHVYERDRIVIRKEPFLCIAGRIAKDDGTINILADEVRPLQLSNLPPQTTVPCPTSPYSLLKDLRRTAPESKNWG